MKYPQVKYIWWWYIQRNTGYVLQPSVWSNRKYKFSADESGADWEGCLVVLTPGGHLLPWTICLVTQSQQSWKNQTLSQGKGCVGRSKWVRALHEDTIWAQDKHFLQRKTAMKSVCVCVSLSNTHTHSNHTLFPHPSWMHWTHCPHGFHTLITFPKAASQEPPLVRVNCTSQLWSPQRLTQGRSVPAWRCCLWRRQSLPHLHESGQLLNTWSSGSSWRSAFFLQKRMELIKNMSLSN